MQEDEGTGEGTNLALVESGGLDLSLLLKAVDDITVRPSDLVGKALRTGPLVSWEVLLIQETGETTNLEGAELASGLEAEDTEGGGNDELLLAVVRRGHTLEELQALKGGGSTGGLIVGRGSLVSSLSSSSGDALDRTHLVGNHAADGLVEDAAGSAVVEGTTLLGVDQMTLV